MGSTSDLADTKGDRALSHARDLISGAVAVNVAIEDAAGRFAASDADHRAIVAELTSVLAREVTA